MAKRPWDPLGTCMSMMIHLLASESMVTTEQMKNRMITITMMYLKTMARRIETIVVATIIATIVEKVVLVA
jgi:hypothetical protein